MNEKMMEQVKNFLSDADEDVICVTLAAGEAAFIEVLLESLPTLALLATVEEAKETAQVIIDLMDALEGRLNECDDHIAAHLLVTEVEIPDDISSLIE